MPKFPPHLTTGSTRPAKLDGKLRLYSMEFCPYAQRARLVLLAKKIPHDIINIDLTVKPDWYFAIHPEGKVPALDTGSKIIVESLDICDYLDETYPENPLYPKDPAAKKRDQEVIQKIGALTTVFYKCLLEKDKKTREEWAAEFAPTMEVFEKELAARGTPFFGGNKPGMVDYMLWPWGERAGGIKIAFGQPLFGDDKFPHVRKWRLSMREDPVANETYHGPETFYKLLERRLKGLPPDYDNL